MNHNKTYGHNFTVVGITQPATLSSYNSMYLGLVPYLGTFKTLGYHDNSTCNDSISSDSTTRTILPVKYYE